MTSPEYFDSQAAIVDGICFETLVPEPVVTLPKKSLVKKILYILEIFLPSSSLYPVPNVPVQLGMRITNNTSSAFRFRFYPIPMPQIIRSDGYEIELLPGSYYHLNGPSESDFPLLMPGDTVTYFLDARIFWCQANQFKLSIYTDGFFWTSSPFKPGTYQIRFKYNNQDLTAKKMDKSGQLNLLTEFWTGEVDTPYKELCMVLS